MDHVHFEGSSALYVPPEHRVAVLVNDLIVQVTTGGKTSTLLDRVTFELPQSNMLAIIGGSGAGKTTLLNALAQRLNINTKNMHFSGLVNYETASSQTGAFARISTAYLQQNDAFLPGLTLRETLRYQADLRLSPSTPAAEKDQLVDLLLALLELDHRGGEIVKSFTNTINLSGGEQRRASLAIQLLSRPQLLFLDEPTTGLDTTLALTLVLVLRKLALPEIGILIVLLIHQPRGEVAALFDQLCVLARGGRLVFYGALGALVLYFKGLERAGVVPPAVNSDLDAFSTVNHIMAMLVKNTSTVAHEEESLRVVDALVAAWREHAGTGKLTPVADERAHFAANLRVFQVAEPLPLYREVAVLIRRTAVITLRDRASLLALYGGTGLLAVITGWIFYKPGGDLAAIRSITSSIYSLLEIVGFSPLTMELQRLWEHEGVFFFKEYKDQVVTIPGFVLLRRIAKFTLEDLPISLIFATVTYFMFGLRLGENFGDGGDGSYFGIYLAITILVCVVSMSLSMLCFALGVDFSTSALIVNVFYQIQNSGCGYFVNAATMPVYVRWVKYVAYFWVAFGALTANQYSDWMGACPYPESDPRCLEYTGNYQLSVLGFPKHWIAAPVGYLFAWIVGFNLLTWIVLRLRNYDIAVAKQRKNKIGGHDDPDFENRVLSSGPLYDEKDATLESVGLSVEGVTLSVEVKTSQNNPFAKKELRVLLHNVTAHFKADAVNAIMGPSGGGKTTFLNLLPLRLPKTSKFSLNGKFFVNSQEVLPQDIAKISAYVTQSDDLLIPHLTVRETLYYQALLRLPPDEHPSIPIYINSLLRRTGLIDCADTPVGSATVKGISGGEKRRVSIAVQLLSRPKILFLDEPTSGLDSATSASVLALLNELAASGTTIITTIHQPSKEIFAKFESLVLFAKGGHVVYDGPTAGVEAYFASLGHGCPQNKNIADHVLDVVSLLLTESKDQLQARVAHLIQAWASREKERVDKEVGVPIDLRRFQRTKVPLYIAFRAVLSRQFKVSIRAPDVIFARVGQVTALGAVYALFFSPLRSNAEGISNRLGLTQSIINLYFCGLVNNLSIYPYERNVFHQEWKDGTYGVGVFSLSYLLVELPFEVFPAIVFSVLTVFPVDLPRTPGMFFTVFLTAFVSINAGESLGIIFNSIMMHLGLVTNVLTNLFILAIFMAGTMSLHMPAVLKGLNYLNPVKYGVQVCVNMGFRGQQFRCAVGDSCLLSTGDAVLDMYGLRANLGGAFGGLVACMVIYRLVGISFAYARVRWLV